MYQHDNSADGIITTLNGVNTSTKLGPRFSTSVANTNHSTDLKEIINNNPEYYLDEIAVELVKKVGVYLPFSTFYKTITKRLKYSLQVCYEAAKQRNEMERRRYKEALQIVVKDPRQVLVIDEAHKDKRASRRRRTWGRRNSGGVTLLKWFRSKVRYTMITGISI